MITPRSGWIRHICPLTGECSQGSGIGPAKLSGSSQFPTQVHRPAGALRPDRKRLAESLPKPSQALRQRPMRRMPNAIPLITALMSLYPSLGTKEKSSGMSGWAMSARTGPLPESKPRIMEVKGGGMGHHDPILKVFRWDREYQCIRKILNILKGPNDFFPRHGRSK